MLKFSAFNIKLYILFCVLAYGTFVWYIKIKEKITVDTAHFVHS